MSAKKKTGQPNKKSLITAYMTETLENERFPVSVFKFCKQQKIEEADFYSVFGSMESLQNGIWVFFFEETQALLEKDPGYAGYGNRERMLSFYFTFFELLGLNRSYVLFALRQSGESMQHLSQLKGLRKKTRSYARDLIEEANAEKNIKLTKHNPDVFAEGAWLQLSFLLRFWLNDDSPGFEKTDVAIEKSVNTIFDIFDNTPLERVLDFGKFLFKEHFA
jgi:hypothetical protein